MVQPLHVRVRQTTATAGVDDQRALASSEAQRSVVTVEVLHNGVGQSLDILVALGVRQDGEQKHANYGLKEHVEWA